MLLWHSRSFQWLQEQPVLLQRVRAVSEAGVWLSCLCSVAAHWGPSVGKALWVAFGDTGWWQGVTKPKLSVSRKSIFFLIGGGFVGWEFYWFLNLELQI